MLYKKNKDGAVKDVGENALLMLLPVIFVRRRKLRTQLRNRRAKEVMKGNVSLLGLSQLFGQFQQVFF